MAKAYAELTTEGWLEARQGMGLYVAAPLQRLSDDERERRLDDAIGRFVNDVIPRSASRLTRCRRGSSTNFASWFPERSPERD